MLWWQVLSLTSFVCSLHTSESIRWPAGSYGIPKPASGCPLADGFQWQEGWRFQDTNAKYSNNAKSTDFHLDAEVDDKKVKRSFCLKTLTADDNNRPDWPTGQYCIYKKGVCPAGLMSGFVYWDDDDYGNLNDKDGILPDGVYNKNTKIEFCCKTDGNKNDAVILPSQSPFYLLAYKSAKCQMVKWAVATVEWIYYDTEDAWNLDSDKRGGAYPHEAVKDKPRIYYCFYHGCNKTLTGISGTFQSPNYPRKYPDGQYCSWRITVNKTQRIHLTFSSFSLQHENNTDELYVYDGENATGQMLGMFYGGHPPPKEGINSSSNKMFVIFKSDNTVSDTGFSATYYAGNRTASSVSTTQTPEVTSLPPSSSKPLHTLEKTTVNSEPTQSTGGPSEESGGKDERKQAQRKGFNVTAVVVPVVLFVFAVLVAAFFYRRRKRTKNNAKQKEVVLSARSNDESRIKISENESPILVESPYYDRNLVVTNANEPIFTEGTDTYTEVKDTEQTNENERYMEQENENPLYEGADTNAVVLNPIYGSDVVIGITNEPSFSEGNEMYTDVKEPENKNAKPYVEQENENPLYEAADADDAVLNPIYDSSI